MLFPLIATLLFAGTAEVEALLVAEKFVAAEREARRMISSRATEPEGQLLLGRALLDRGDFTAAIKAFDRASDLRPRLAAPHLWKARALIESCRRAGILCWISELPAARGKLEEAAKLEPRNAEVAIDRVRYFVLAPFVIGGSRDRAKQEATALATHDRSAAEFALGYISFHDEQHAEAERHFSRSKLDEAVMWRIWLAQMKHDWRLAFSLAESLALRPKWNCRASFEFARTAAFSGERLDEARTKLTEYVATTHSTRHPSNAEAYRWLGAVEERAGRTAAAIAAYRHSLKLDRGQTASARALGRLR